MRIEELFKQDIHRDIKGVITIGKETDSDVQKELQEYVITRELDKHFREFAKSYLVAVDGNTEKIGVWISGFFGSGKSHFLKMLSYLLANQEAGGKKALDYFQGKFPDPTVEGNYRRITTSGTTDVILFNIDAKSTVDSKLDKEAIVKVLLNVFNGYLGFHANHPTVADLERKMAKDGTYESFKERYYELSGGTRWEGVKRPDGVIDNQGRDTFDFDHDTVTQALADAGVMKSLKEAEAWYQKASTAPYEISIEKFAELVREYCDSKGKDHRVVFLIDEVGQYIGTDSKLMLNLQTVAEELGKTLAGRAWIIVTAQEAMDKIVSDLHGNDFSKIMGRFATRLSLSSTNADEVIRRRLLEKKSVAADTLRALYAEKSAILRNAISFSANAAEMKSWQDEKDFVDSYPFVPYQMRLMQKVFESIRRYGETGKHLSEGERSLLSAFHESAKRVAGSDLGLLVPLSHFYDSLETFLDSSVRRVIDQAMENDHLQPQDIPLLKILFMIKHVKELPKTLENLLILSLSQIDEDKPVLRKQLQESLDRLVKQTLIQKDSDEYIFLTDDEQDVDRGIKAVEVSPREIIDSLNKIAYDEIYNDSKIIIRKRPFQFDRRFDGVSYGKLGNTLVFHFLSPQGDGYDDDAFVTAMRHVDGGIVVFRLPDTGFYREAEEQLQIQKYLNKGRIQGNTKRLEDIINGKKTRLTRLTKEIKESLEQAISRAEVFIEGTKTSLSESSAKEMMEAALRRLAETVYSKFDYIDKSVTDTKDIGLILRANDIEQLSLDGWEHNQQALNEVERYLQRQASMHKKVTMKTLLDEFMGRPYGWSETDVQAIVARLLVRENIQARYSNSVVDRRSKDLGGYLTSNRETEKLVLEPKVQTEKAILEKARLILRELTNQGNWPEKEGDFYDKAHNALHDLHQEVKEYAARQQSLAFPGSKATNDALAAFSGLTGISDPNEFFTAIKSQESSLRDIADDLTFVKTFFSSNQVAIWSDAQQKLMKYDAAQVFLDSEARAALQEIKDILAMPAPYGRIKDLPGLVDRASNSYDKALATEKKKADDEVTQHVNTAREYLQESGLPEAAQAEVLKPLQEMAEIFNASTDLNQVISLHSRIHPAYEAALDDAEKRKQALQPPSGGGAATTTTTKPQIKRVRLAAIVAEAKPMKTEQDVEEFISSLRQQLLDSLKDNAEVRLQ